MSDIEQLVSEATYLDTSSFTLDSLKARQKLNQFQLPHSGLWLVKLVQAAVATGAPEIVIEFARSAVKVRFQAPDLPEAGSLLSLVMSGQLPQQAGLLHLTTALRACAGATTEALEWHCGGKQVHLGPGTTSQAESPHPGFLLIATRPPRNRGLSKTLATSLAHLIRNTAEEYEAVAERCWTCPIPILLDGRPLPRGYDSPLLRGLLNTPGEVLLQYEKSRVNLATFCVGVRQIPPLPHRPTLAALESRAELKVPVLKNGTFLRWPDEGHPIGAALTVQAYRQCGHRIDFVWDGAVVASQELPLEVASPSYVLINPRIFQIKWEHHVGLRLIVGVQGEELDLSQFEVREKAQLTEQLLQEVRLPLVELLEELLKKVDQLYYFPLTPRGSKAYGLGMGAAGLGLGLSGGWLVAPVMAAGLGGGFFLQSLGYRHQVKKALQAILEALQPPGLPET